MSEEGLDENRGCVKCGKHSGDAWEQCGGSCPVPQSPHYDPRWATRHDVTIVPPACGKKLYNKFGEYAWTCGDAGGGLMCDGCEPLGHRLASAVYAWFEFSNAWPSVIALNLTLAALMCVAVRRAFEGYELPVIKVNFEALAPEKRREVEELIARMKNTQSVGRIVNVAEHEELPL